MPASRVIAGDTITGIWSESSYRWTPDYFHVRNVKSWVAPNGREIVTVIGPQDWMQRSYVADTYVRVRIHQGGIT
jgi:hypothetical protein